jgi:hypothetical protein
MTDRSYARIGSALAANRGSSGARARGVLVRSWRPLVGYLRDVILSEI